MRNATVLLVFEELQDLENYGILFALWDAPSGCVTPWPKESKPSRLKTSL